MLGLTLKYLSIDICKKKKKRLLNYILGDKSVYRCLLCFNKTFYRYFYVFMNITFYRCLLEDHSGGGLGWLTRTHNCLGTSRNCKIRAIFCFYKASWNK